MKRAGVCVVAKPGDRALKLVDDVGVTDARIEREMPWARAGSEIDRLRIIGLELARRGVKAVDENLVAAKVADEGEAIGWVDDGLVGVRAFLPVGVHALSAVLDRGRGG